MLICGIALPVLALDFDTPRSDFTTPPGGAPVPAPSQEEGDEASDKEQNRTYQKCIALAQKNPEQGFETASGWRGIGGGSAAEHCAAVALLGLGQYEKAATRLETLGHRALEEPHVKAGLFSQAGQAWLLHGDPQKATTAFSIAVSLTPRNPQFYIDRAQAWAERGDYQSAETDLSQALILQPSDPDVYALRASARRFLDKNEEALADTNTALEIIPNHPEALLERGILKRLAGDRIGARLDWLRLVNRAPDTPAAASARRNIELMDVRQAEPPPLR